MKVDEIWRVWTVGAKLLFIIEIPMLILIEQVLKQYWYVSRCANNELAPCILKLKNNTEWKQTTVTEITENRFGNFRFWGENMLDRFGFFSFSSPDLNGPFFATIYSLFHLMWCGLDPLPIHVQSLTTDRPTVLGCPQISTFVPKATAKWCITLFFYFRFVFFFFFFFFFLTSGLPHCPYFSCGEVRTFFNE